MFLAPTEPRIPAQGNALGTIPHPFPRSEGTQHFPGCQTHRRMMRRSFRTHPLHCPQTQRCTLGRPRPLARSEGTPHIPQRRKCRRTTLYAAFLQNAGMGDDVSPGRSPGLVCRRPFGAFAVVGGGENEHGPVGLDKHPLQAGGFELLELGELERVFGNQLVQRAEVLADFLLFFDGMGNCE